MDVDIVKYLWAGLAVGLAGIWVAIWQGILGRAAVEVMGKRKEMSSFFLTVSILGIALVESAAIYGFIVAMQLLNHENITLLASAGTGVSIWFAGLWAGVWEGILIAGAIRAIDRNPAIRSRIMTMMVLFVALVESAAIYGLITSLQILWAEDITKEFLLWKWLSVGLSWLWVAIGMWILSAKSVQAMSKREDLSKFLLTITILGIALVESAAIYWLVVANSISGLWLYWALWAWLAIWLTGLWAWLWEGILIWGALSSMVRNPSMKSKIMTFMVLFLALAEVTAIYGLVIAFQITPQEWVDAMRYMGSGLSIGFAGLWVAIWIWILSEQSLKIMGQNPNMSKFMLTITILWVALLESAAIYALLVSFSLIPADAKAVGMSAIWAALAVWLAGLWAGVWEGIIIKGAMKGMNKNPEEKGKLMAFMVLFVALVEVVAIYGLIIAAQAVF